MCFPSPKQSSKSLVRYFASSDKERDDFAREMRPLAKKYHEYLLFATIDTNEYPETLAVFGHQPGSTRVLSVQNPSNGHIFPYSGAKQISPEVVEAFLVDITNGKVTSWSGQLPQGGKEEGADEGMKHEEL